MRLSESRWFVTAAALLGITIPGVWLVSLVTPGEEAIKVRNSLIIDLGRPADFAWTPQDTPATFLTNQTGSSPEFVRLATSVVADAGDAPVDGLDLALALSRKLMSAPKRPGGAIQAGLDESFDGIVEKGQGYCADFTRVFSGLAVAANLPVRTWSISFETFGAGHSFSEIYDERLDKWVMIDSFHSLYFIDPVTRAPLSVIEVHDRLLGIGGNAGNLAIQTIVNDRLPFKSLPLAMDYYRRGMPQLAMVWGNNVFDYDESAAIRWSALVSRHLERTVAIASGQLPDLRVYPKGVSHRDLDAVTRIRNRFVAAMVSLVVGCIVCGALLVSTWRRPDLRRSATGDAALQP